MTTTIAGLEPDSSCEPNGYSYETHEDLNEHFSQQAMVPALDATTGAKTVMSRFNEWFWNQPQYAKIDVVIPPRAEDSLVFPTLHQLFEAINNLLREREQPNVNSAELLGRFGFEQIMLNQPVNTFSTGEKILSVIARAMAMAPIANSLIIADPSHNLFSQRRHHLTDLIREYRMRRVPIHYFELKGGSADLASFQRRVATLVPIPPRPLQLAIRNASVTFPEVFYPFYSPARRLRYRSATELLEVASPCLITGENGVGKTTLMKALCELVPDVGGTLNLATDKFRHSKPRLLFNETEAQMFAIRPMEHIGAVFTFDKKKREEAVRLFDDLQNRFSATCSRCGIKSDLHSDISPAGQLQAKLALIAERVIAMAGSIVLDEPTTGLNIEQGTVFLYTIAQLCSERDIGMLVISHDEFRDINLFNSHIHLNHASDGAVDVAVRKAP